MTAQTLTLPPLDGVLASVRAVEDPVVRFHLARRFDDGVDLGALRSELARAPSIMPAFASQRNDGSWGADEDPRRRVLTTLWMAKVLAELGLDDTHPGWHRAAEFLAANAHTEHDALSVDGARGGVLSCYIGIAGETYLLGGRPDLARPQVEWIARYQEVRSRGGSKRSRPAETWDERLRTRYGGCLADTTCLIGLVKTGRALAAWDRHEPDARARELMQAMREVYLERRLMYRSNGGIVPIGVYGGAPDRWLQPTWPLDWHTDLIEVLDFVAHGGPPDPRMQPAIDELASLQLPDGTWPLRQSYRPAELPASERRSKHKGSPMITLRVVSALAACGARPT